MWKRYKDKIIFFYNMQIRDYLKKFLQKNDNLTKLNY